jgi:RNA polymerase sigma-70 factor (ECF subfamily)
MVMLNCEVEDGRLSHLGSLAGTGTSEALTSGDNLETAPDQTLAKAASRGDEKAFELLVERYQDRVYRLASRLCANRSDAEEVVQETFLGAFRGLGGFRGNAAFATWLYQIVVNAALTQRRGMRRHPTASLEECFPRFDDTGTLEPGDYGRAARADEMLERKELLNRVQEALDRLGDDYRTVFVLRDLEGLSTEEVADVFGICPTAVRQRLHRARLQLRGFLDEVLGSR